MRPWSRISNEAILYAGTSRSAQEVDRSKVERRREDAQARIRRASSNSSACHSHGVIASTIEVEEAFDPTRGAVAHPGKIGASPTSIVIDSGRYVCSLMASAPSRRSGMIVSCARCRSTRRDSPRVRRSRTSVDPVRPGARRSAGPVLQSPSRRYRAMPASAFVGSSTSRKPPIENVASEASFVALMNASMEPRQSVSRRSSRMPARRTDGPRPRPAPQGPGRCSPSAQDSPAGGRGAPDRPVTQPSRPRRAIGQDRQGRPPAS